MKKYRESDDDTWTCSKTFEDINFTVWEIDASKDGQILAAACDDGKIKIF